MKMDINKALGVLKHGMSTEIWGLEFYQQALTRTVDETGRKVFASLVEEEESHLKILRGEYAALSGSKAGWITREEALELAASVDPTTIFPEPQAAEALIPADASDLDVLAIAMDFENKGYTFYQSEAALADSPEAKRMWAQLAKAENNHYTFLQKSHEYLANNGVWFFDENELPFFEG